MTPMYWNNSNDLIKIEKFLNEDQILLSSTDTVFGLLGRVTQQSYDKINQIKERKNKPYIILIGSIDKPNQFIDQKVDAHLEKIIQLSWPGPVTLIFKAKQTLPNFIKNDDGTVALRMPNHTGLLQLLKNYDGLFSTSANISTEPIPASFNELNKKIIDQVSGMCIDSLDSFNKLQNSTILDCCSTNIKIVRIGSDLSNELKKIIK